jgi:hypothetical protein
LISRGKVVIRALIALFLALAASAAPASGPVTMATLYSLTDRDSLEAAAEQARLRYAAVPDDPDALRRLGIAYHNLAMLGVGGASQKAVDYLSRLTQLLPDDHVVLAYRGSATTMLGRDSWNIVTRIDKVRLGIAQIDDAVLQENANIIIRMVRATNSLLLPDWFGRKAIARQDFAFVVQALEARKDADPQLLSQACYQLAMLHSGPSGKDQRKAWLEKARDAAPASDWGMKAAKALLQ